MDTFDISLVDCLVDLENFEDYMSNDFRVFNPVIYKLIYQAASLVENKVVTFESRYEYYSSQIFFLE